MNIIRENKGDLNVSLKIQIDEADYSVKVDQTLKEYRRKANIPGFRPGMVPASLVKKMYGKSIAADEINKLISDSIEQYIEKEQLKILGQPLPNYDINQTMDLDTEKSFEFSVDLGLAPEVTVDLTGITADRFIVVPEDHHIDKTIKEITFRHGLISEVDVAEEQDMLFGSFHQLNDDDSVMDEGLHSSRSLSITNIVDENTREQFIGLKKGDAVIFNPVKAFGTIEDAATFMSLKNEDLEGVTSNFRYEVEHISRNTPVAIDEELFKKVFPNQPIADESAFRVAVGQMISTEHQNQADGLFFREAVASILNANKLPMPTEFLRRFSEVTMKKESRPKTDADFENFIDGIRWELIENKLAEENNITVEESEVRSFTANVLISNYFQFMQGMENAEENEYIKSSVDKVLSDKEQARRIVDSILENKIIKLLIEKLAVNEKRVSFNEFFESVKQKNSKE